MQYSRQTEYNVQQTGELHNKSRVGVRKQKCLEAGTVNAEVGGRSDMWRQIVPDFRAGDRKCPITDQSTQWRKIRLCPTKTDLLDV